MARQRFGSPSGAAGVLAMAVTTSFTISIISSLAWMPAVVAAMEGQEGELGARGGGVFGESRWLRPGDGRSLRGRPSAESRLRAAMTDSTTTRYELKTSVKLTRSLPSLNKDFTLVGKCGGKGCEINGQGRFRGFITSSSLFLSHLELVGMATVGTSLQSDSYDTSGGAVFMRDGQLTVSKCVFRGNKAKKAGGGAIAMVDSRFTISDSIFMDNSAEGSGGALIVWSNSFGELRNTGLSGNKAGLFGGAAYFRESSVKAVSCAFAANKAGENGGALLLSESDATIAKTSFVGNSAPNGLGGAVRVLLEGREVVVCSSTTFQGNSAKVKSTNDVSVESDEEGTLIYCPKPPAKGPSTCSDCT